MSCFVHLCNTTQASITCLPFMLSHILTNDFFYVHTTIVTSKYSNYICKSYLSFMLIHIKAPFIQVSILRYYIIYQKYSRIKIDWKNFYLLCFDRSVHFLSYTSWVKLLYSSFFYSCYFTWVKLYLPPWLSTERTPTKKCFDVQVNIQYSMFSMINI